MLIDNCKTILLLQSMSMHSPRIGFCHLHSDNDSLLFYHWLTECFTFHHAFHFCNHIIWSFIRKYRKHNTLSPFILSVVHFKWWKDVTLWYSISRQHKMLLKHLYDIVTSHKRYDEALFRISNQSIFHYLDFQYFLFASDLRFISSNRKFVK